MKSLRSIIFSMVAAGQSALADYANADAFQPPAFDCIACGRAVVWIATVIRGPFIRGPHVWRPHVCRPFIGWPFIRRRARSRIAWRAAVKRR